MSGFKLGLQSLLVGFKLIFKPGIRLYVIVPFLINSLLFIGVIYFGANSLQEYLDLMILKYEWLEWIKWLLKTIFVIISLAVVFFCFTFVSNILGAPFNSFLSEAVERHLVQTDKLDILQRPIIDEVFLSFKSEFEKLGYFIPRAIPLLILFIIPVINVSAPFLWFLFSTWMLSIEYMDYPLSNHGLIFKDQRIMLMQNKSMTFGFGIGVVGLTTIPILNFIAMPIAIAGATKLYVEQREKLSIKGQT